MTTPAQRQALRDAASVFEEPNEPRTVGRKRARVEATEPDVQMLSFPETPAVAVERTREVELRLLAVDRVSIGRFCVDWKLDLLRGDERRASGGAVEHPGDGTEMTGSAHQHRRF